MLSGGLKRLMRGGALDAKEAEEVFGEALDERDETTLAAALLVAWRMKGESADEITGAARAARARGEAPLFDGPVLDLCGTGGDNRHTFNISTAAAVVAASAGARVLKVVSPLLTSRCGSREVLEELGVNCDAPLPRVAGCLEEHGLAFLSRAVANPKLDALARAAQSLGVRTLVDLVVPLASPASTQLLGVHDARLLDRVSEALVQLGTPRAWVVHGKDGADEVTLADATLVRFVEEGGLVRSHEVRPADAGLDTTPPEAFKGGTPKENAAMLRELLAGERQGPLADVVVLNAGAALVVSGEVETLRRGVERAREVLRSGAPWRLFEEVAGRVRG